MEENQLIKERIRKLNELKETINPFPYTYKKTHDAADLKKEYKEGKEASVAGRIRNMRRMGKATFLHVQDESGQIQVYLRSQDVEDYDTIKKLESGDFIGVKGTLFKTKKGEISIYTKEFTVLCKSIRPLPEKYHGLKDKEIRFRKRYLDLIMNQDVKDLFKKRSLMVKGIRNYLDEKGFMEVETPLLQTQYGGANARPFTTHINAWDMDLYLSISPELYLKRLIIGGYEKVFTICKNFRNEGVDHSHNPEFTMLELYEAYSDYNEMMRLTEELYEKACIAMHGTTKVTHVINGEEVIVDFKAPWKRLTIREAIKEYLDIDIEEMDRDQLASFCREKKIEVKDSFSWGDLVIEIFDELIEPKIIQPTHVYDRPKEGTPLCKRHREDPKYNEQCEPIALGMELANMYSELNDPLQQMETFKAQEEKGRGGDEEAHPMDKDFIEALETGMPPTGGNGIGIDRMLIVLTGSEGIRDVIFFPTMKPR